ncbi:MAG: putative capsid protein [Circoviridae sp.]|nr:MAG: putative capsid protein [Circoviridae sp.]
MGWYETARKWTRHQIWDRFVEEYEIAFQKTTGKSFSESDFWNWWDQQTESVHKRIQDGGPFVYGVARERIQTIIDNFEGFNPRKRRRTGPGAPGQGLERATDDEKIQHDMDLDTGDDEKTDEPRQPDKKKTDGPDMSGLTSHSMEHCCVDLGTIKAKVKSFSGIQRDKLTQKSKHYQWSRAVYDIPATKKRIAQLMGPVQAAVFASGFHEPNINSADMGISSWMTAAYLRNTISSNAFTDPTYAGLGEGVTDFGSGHRAIIMQNQFLEWTFKNCTGAGHGTAETTNTTPIFCTVYAVSPKELVYGTGNTSTASTDHQNYTLQDDVRRSFAERLTSTQITNYSSTGFNINWFNDMGDSGIQDEYNVIDKKSFCLAGGQQGTLRCFVKQPQYLSYRACLEGAPFKSIGGLGPDYLGVMMTPAETQFIIVMHGGIACYAADANLVGSEVNTEASKLGVLCRKRLEYRQANISREDYQYTQHDTAAATAYLADIDLDQPTNV